jgi:hypothetical protein
MAVAVTFGHAIGAVGADAGHDMNYFRRVILDRPEGVLIAYSQAPVPELVVDELARASVHLVSSLPEAAYSMQTFP